MEYSARTEPCGKCGVLRIVRIFRFFLRVQVIQVSIKLVEAVNSGQKFVSVAEVILANLRRGVSERLEQIGYRRVFLLDSER